MVTDRPNPPPLLEVEDFRQLAAEARAMAERYSDPSTKKGMLHIAAMYDRLADSAEQHLARCTRSEK
jgi:hypothetical protein